MKDESPQKLREELWNQFRALPFFERETMRISGTLSRPQLRLSRALDVSEGTISRHLRDTSSAGMAKNAVWLSDHSTQVDGFITREIEAMKAALEDVRKETGGTSDVEPEEAAEFRKAIEAYDNCKQTLITLGHKQNPSGATAGGSRVLIYSWPSLERGKNALVAAAISLGYDWKFVLKLASEPDVLGGKLAEARAKMFSRCLAVGNWLSMFCAMLEYARKQSAAGRKCEGTFRATVYLTVPSDNEKDPNDVILLKVARSSKAEVDSPRGVAYLRKSMNRQYAVTQVLNEDSVPVGLGDWKSSMKSPTGEERTHLPAQVIARGWQYEGIGLGSGLPAIVFSLDIVVDKKDWGTTRCQRMLDTLGWDGRGAENDPLTRAIGVMKLRFESMLFRSMVPFLDDAAHELLGGRRGAHRPPASG